MKQLRETVHPNGSGIAIITARTTHGNRGVSGAYESMASVSPVVQATLTVDSPCVETGLLH